MEESRENVFFGITGNLKCMSNDTLVLEIGDWLLLVMWHKMGLGMMQRF